MKPRCTAPIALDHYRRVLRPDEAVRERVLRELGERLALGEVPRLSAQAPAAPRSAAPPVASKSLLALAAAGGLCVLALTATRLGWVHDLAGWLQGPGSSVRVATQARVSNAARSTVQQSPPPIAAEYGQPASQSSSRLEVQNATPAAPQAEPGAARPRRQHAGVRSARTRAHDARSGEQPPAAMGSDSALPDASASARPVVAATKDSGAQNDLEAELRLMGLAHDALRSGQPERALVFLEEHAVRFPRGALAQSRKVTRIMALCQAGKAVAARGEARRFLALSPSSPYAARVRSLCSEPATDSRP